ncbi:FeoB-associated Cys-rich membrane protein [Ectobacillus panaciterrae]|uniref:FeoB-associated Cys-rich membrane protein n=1 Tax=Ectobacillus panaciterrae TaxID=363872 RepID=UPI0009D754EF|nr:FeoB-associated Cys-rich membrane protein [Ectobacillus panaciterrae]
MINITIGTLIFVYAGYSLTKFIKKSKKGKCAACSLNTSCASSCDTTKGLT